MKPIHIFIETSISETKKNAGIFTNEYHFVEDYLHHIMPGIEQTEYTITDVGGKDKLRFFANQMKQNQKLGEQNLVIFDCDSSLNGGGYEKGLRKFLP